MDFILLQLTFILMVIINKTLCVKSSEQPHIIYILADDLGWNDVSYHGSDQIPTPNIDSLAYNGVILNRHYALPSCTPSRASLMSGKYPIHTGQHIPTIPPQRTALDLSIKIMPQYFKDIGYSTHIVGKWHLGYYKKEFTPLERGFDSHFGYWTGALSYYDHTNEDFAHNGINGSNLCGHDLRRNFSSALDVLGEYATDLFTSEASKVITNHPKDRPMFLYLAHLAAHAGNEGRPLEAPIDEIKKFMYISNPNRRAYAAMVSKLDQSVGIIVATLARKDMLQNSIIVFASDNGAPNLGQFKNWGSNYPFRGQKQTLWEGGVRVPALIWSPRIDQRSRIFNGLMHITDWLPTLLAASGVDTSSMNIDGLNQWKAISMGYSSPRTNLVVEINDKNKISALISKHFKYINGARGPLSSKSDGYLNMDTIFSKNMPMYNTKKVITSDSWIALKNIVDNSNLKRKILKLREASRISCEQFLEQELIHCEDSPCLFDIIKDPCEQINIANEFPVLTRYFENVVEQLRLNQFPEDPYVIDPEANPDLHNGTWDIWQI